MTKAKQTKLDFGAYAKQGPSASVARFTTDLKNPENGDPVILHVKHSGKGNQQFVVSNMRVMKSVVQKNKGLKNKLTSLSNQDDIESILDITPEEMEGLMETQAKQRRVYARSVIVGWENVTIDGAEIPFSVENCESMLEGMDQVYFDRLADYCQDVKNFDTSLSDDLDLVGEQAKNALGN